MWLNDLVSDVGVGHLVDVVVFSRSYKYYWRIELIGNQIFYIKYSMLGEDVTVLMFLAVENSTDMWTEFIPPDKPKLTLGLTVRR